MKLQQDKSLALERARLIEALEELVCCPAFSGAVFEKDPQSHRAWSIGVMLLEEIKNAKDMETS